MRQSPNPPDTLEVTSVLHALADPARLSIVTMLARNDTPIPCGSFEVGISKSTLSHHFAVLRQAGVIETTREGQRAYNHLRRAQIEAAFPGLIDAILPQR